MNNPHPHYIQNENETINFGGAKKESVDLGDLTPIDVDEIYETDDDTNNKI